MIARTRSDEHGLGGANRIECGLHGGQRDCRLFRLLWPIVCPACSSHCQNGEQGYDLAEATSYCLSEASTHVVTSVSNCLARPTCERLRDRLPQSHNRRPS